MSHPKQTQMRVMLLAGLLLAVFYFGLQFSTSRIIENDGHFHIRYSQLMLERGIPGGLTELRYTIWNDSYRDHHFLFHVMLIPFSLLPDLTLGAKTAAATFATIAGIVFVWALFRFGVRVPWPWLILFAAGSSGFLYRTELPRVQSLALALLLVISVALMEKRCILIFFAAFANVWLYDSFLLLVIVAGLWMASMRITLGRTEWRPAASLFLGLASGIIINPFFPRNISSYAFSIYRSLAPLESIPLPAEWMSETGWHLLIDNLPIILIAVGLMAITITVGRGNNCENKESRSERLFLALTAVFFLALLMRSRRFIEYTPPVALLFLATVHRDAWPALLPKTKRALAVAAFVIAGIGGVLVASNFVISTQPDDTYRCYMDAGKWMDKNIPRGETVFPSDWDDFPMLYLNAANVRYVVGMDPLFMLEYDKAMYDEYCSITRGIQEGPYSPVIRDRFDADYVFTDTQHGNFLSVFDKEPGVFRVFSQPQCRIYRIGPR